MKRIIECDEKLGLDSLMGKKVLIFCLNYIYTGLLVGIDETCIELKDPAIVYETGAFTSSNYQDKQNLHTDKWFISRSAIESFGISKEK